VRSPGLPRFLNRGNPLKRCPELLKCLAGQTILVLARRPGLGLSSTKKLYVCGSSKFLHEIEELEARLRRENVEYLVSKRTSSRGIRGCLEKIDHADIVYVVNPRGYVGRSVSVDIGYAYARGKPVYALHSIDDPPVMDLLTGVLSYAELIELLKQ